MSDNAAPASDSEVEDNGLEQIRKTLGNAHHQNSAAQIAAQLGEKMLLEVSDIADALTKKQLRDWLDEGHRRCEKKLNTERCR